MEEEKDMLSTSFCNDNLSKPHNPLSEDLDLEEEKDMLSTSFCNDNLSKPDDPLSEDLDLEEEKDEKDILLTSPCSKNSSLNSCNCLNDDLGRDEKETTLQERIDYVHRMLGIVDDDTNKIKSENKECTNQENNSFLSQIKDILDNFPISKAQAYGRLADDLKARKVIGSQARMGCKLGTLSLTDGDTCKIKSENKESANQENDGFFSRINKFITSIIGNKSKYYGKLANALKLTVEERLHNHDPWLAARIKFLDKTLIPFAEVISGGITEVLEDKRARMKDLELSKRLDEKSIDNGSENDFDMKNVEGNLVEIFKPNISLENIPYKVKCFLIYELEDLKNENRDKKVEFDLFFLLVLYSLGCKEVNIESKELEKKAEEKAEDIAVIDEIQMNMLDAGGRVADSTCAINVSTGHQALYSFKGICTCGFLSIGLGLAVGGLMHLLGNLAHGEGEEMFKTKLCNILRHECCDDLENMNNIMSDIIGETEKEKESILNKFIEWEKQQYR